MSEAVLHPARVPVAIPIREILPWAVLCGLLCLIAIYFVDAEESATSLTSGTSVHEFGHDGRHLLGFPCHRSADAGARALLHPSHVGRHGRARPRSGHTSWSDA